MQSTKPLVRSTSVWGTAVGVVGLLGILPDILAVVRDLEPAAREIVNHWAVGIGLIMTFVGRLKADKRISGIFK